MHSKTKKKQSVGIELRAGGNPHRSEKPGWSAGDMRHWPKQKKCIGIRFLLRDFAVSFFDLFKVSKITTKFFDLFKVAKSAIQGAAIPSFYKKFSSS